MYSFPEVWMRYIPTFVFMTLADSLGRVATCGRVMNAPPSSGQQTSCGKSESLHSTKSLMLPLFWGSEWIPVRAAWQRAFGRACLKNSTGFDLKRTAVWVPARVLRNRKSSLSCVPKILHAARRGDPLTCSKRRAGPWFSTSW